MSDLIKKGRKKLEELFIKSLGITTEEFLKVDYSYLLQKDLEAEVCVSPPDHYTVNKDVILKKGFKVKLSAKSKDYKFQPLGYSNNFFIEMVDPQIVNLGDIYVNMESFIKAVKL